jgi:nitroreductase
VTTHPDRALEQAVRAAAALWRAHPSEHYMQTWARWANLRPGNARRLARLDEVVSTLARGTFVPDAVPGLAVLLVLRQQEAEALASAIVRQQRSRGVSRGDRRAAIKAMESYVLFAARSGIAGCPLTGPVTVPLVRKEDRR